MIVRDYLCLRCKHRWIEEVVFSKPGELTPISGEKTVYCPMCNTRECMGTAHRRVRWFLVSDLTLSRVKTLAEILATTGRGVDCDKALQELVHEIDSGSHESRGVVPSDYLQDDGK